MFLDGGLDEDYTPFRIEPGREPFQEELPGKGRNASGVFVFGGKGVPVGHEIETIEFFLEIQPVLKDSVQMPQM